MTVEGDICLAYNDYLESYNELCRCIRNSEMSLMKSLLSFKLTERDEIRFALADTRRLALTCVTFTENKEEFKLDVKSTLTNEKKKENEEGTLRNRKNGREESVVVEQKQKEAEKEKGETIPKVLDPVKLIHGGFTTFAVRESQRDASVTLNQIVNVINKKRRVLQLVKNYEQNT